jgi:hypothetical protein
MNRQRSPIAASRYQWLANLSLRERNDPSAATVVGTPLDCTGCRVRKDWRPLPSLTGRSFDRRRRHASSDVAVRPRRNVSTRSPISR